MAEIGERDVHGVKLKILEMLKWPPNEATRDWRALAILETEAKHPKPDKDRQNKDFVHAGTSKVEEDPLPPLLVETPAAGRLPPKGTQGLFFLWSRLEPAGGAPLRYKLDHPQNLYDIQYAAEVKAELARSRSATRRPFLRAWDEEMAGKRERRRLDDDLLKLEPGAVQRGLRLEAVRARRSIRDDNSFDLTVRVENTRATPQAIYDGLVSGFGVLIRRKGQAREEAVVLPVFEKNLTQDMDPAVLAVVDATDFSLVREQDSLTKELHFEAKDFAFLAKLDGEFLLQAFYRTQHDGERVENMVAPAWTGVLLSPEIALEMKAAVAAGPADGQP
ncbi:MAG: hypothetical protein M5U26_10235 [Planctomycetota bacterium]|nr:hypothetical protein [Planctomycetota bacterium]